MAICLRLIETKHYAEARARLKPILEIYHDWPRANLIYALAFHKDGLYGEAKPYFENALRLDPQELAVLPFLGWCLYYLGDLEGSRDRFDTYLRIVNPNYSDAHFALGLIAYDRDDIEAARSRFETAIGIAAAEKDAPVEGKARARLADVLIRTGDLPRAREELEKALQLRPDAYAAWFKLSRVRQRLGDEKGAEEARRMHDEVRERVRPSGKSGTMGPRRYDGE
jgi:Tfp pilus assembly protein PilF